MIFVIGLLLFVTAQTTIASDYESPLSEATEYSQDDQLDNQSIQLYHDAAILAMQNVNYLFADVYQRYPAPCERIIQKALHESRVDTAGLLIDTEALIDKMKFALTALEDAVRCLSETPISTGNALSKLRCKHVFHKRCIRKLFQFNDNTLQKCPHCRAAFRKKEVYYVHPKRVHNVRKEVCGICLCSLK